LGVALELADEDERRQEHARERRVVFQTAAELGVAEHHVARAERVVAERADATARRRKAFVAIVMAALATCAGAVAWAVATAPDDPWTVRFEEPDQWTLEATPGTVAVLAWPRQEGASVASVRVDYVHPSDSDDSWRVDLRGGVPPIGSGHERLVIELSGSLPRARLCLHAGPDERWCSGSLEVTRAWKEHTITLRSLQHERIIDGRWDTPRRSERRPPDDVGELSLRLGRRVNPSDATGAVLVRAIRVE